MKLDKVTIAKLIVSAIGLVAGIIVANMAPPETLTEKSMLGLGIFIFFVVCSMVEIIQDYVCWVLMCAAWVVTGCVKFNVAFAAFSGTTMWLVIGAMVLAAAVAQSGLLKRITLVVMTKFPVTYKWQAAALTIASLVIAPLIPSGTVKGTIMAPFVVAISDSLGLKRRSDGATGLFVAMFMASCYVLPTVISASFINYVILGALAEGQKVSYLTWVIAALPWLVLTMGVGFFMVTKLYKVKPSEITATTSGLVEEHKKIGKMTRNERITAVVLVCCLVLWVLERKLGISSALVTIFAMAILSLTKVVDRQAFRSKVTWDAIVFLGCALSMITAFPAMGIDKWISGFVTPIVGPILADNILIFIVVFCLLIYGIRFFIGSMTALVALFMVFLVPVANAAGVHPWIMGFVAYCAANGFIFKYQHIMYLPAMFAAETAAGEVFFEHKKVMPFLLYYMVSNIIFLCASIPVWRLLGWV